MLGSDPGPVSMLVGYCLLGVQPIVVKALATRGVGAPIAVSARFVVALTAVFVICALRKRWLETKQPRLLLLRGVLGGVAVLAYFSSIQLAGAGRGTVLNYTYPIWANLFAFLFLAQRPPLRFWLLLTLAVAGVFLIVWPHDERASQDFGWGEVLGLGSALFAGGAVLCIKLLRNTDESLSIIASFSVLGLLFSLPFSTLALLEERARLFGSGAAPLVEWSAPVWLLLGAVGLLAFSGHLFFTRGYRGTSVQLGTVLSLTVPVVATALGAWVFAEPLGWRFLLGSILVLLAITALGLAPPEK